MDMEEKDITSAELEKEKLAQSNSYRSFRMKEEYWRIKSRGLWLKAGDQNTSFFHRQFRARLSRNHIMEIKNTKGQVCKGFDKIKAATESHFKNLYSLGTNGSDEDTPDFL